MWGEHSDSKSNRLEGCISVVLECQGSIKLKPGSHRRKGPMRHKVISQLTRHLLLVVFEETRKNNSASKIASK
jgi:hypothetical protein